MNPESIANPEDFAGYFDTPRVALLDLYQPTTAPDRILDIGCGAGASLRALKKRFPNAQTVGLEGHPGAASIARERASCDQLVEADLLDPMLSERLDGNFDLIVLSHVLEHFAAPELILTFAKTKLAVGGSILCAVPNLRHIAVVLPLVFLGEFKYRDAGVLDRTHLRFFTKRSAIRFYQENGFEVVKVATEIGGTESRLFHFLTLGLARPFAAFGINALLRRVD